jgi:hypothetical protein
MACVLMYAPVFGSAKSPCSPKSVTKNPVHSFLQLPFLRVAKKSLMGMMVSALFWRYWYASGSGVPRMGSGFIPRAVARSFKGTSLRPVRCLANQYSMLSDSGSGFGGRNDVTRGTACIRGSMRGRRNMPQTDADRLARSVDELIGILRGVLG